MNKYELVVVLSAKLEEEERTAAIEKVKGYIARYGGTVEGVDDWGRKKLAYEIQKSREACYYLVNFESEADCPSQVEDHVRLMESVVRFLCVKKDPKAEAKKASRPRPEEKPVQAETEPVAGDSTEGAQ